MPLTSIENLTIANKQNVVKHVKKAALENVKDTKPEMKAVKKDTLEEPLLTENPRSIFK